MQGNDLKTEMSTAIEKEVMYVTELFTMNCYYMALSHKDWELPNSRIWLAENDIDRGLDFPI